MRKIVSLLMVIVIFFFNSNVYAACDKNDINRLKEIAKNVQITYEHNVYGDINSVNDSNTELTSIYDIMITGLTDELYIVDNGGGRYNYSDIKDDVISIKTSSGEKKFFVFSKNCKNVVLDTRVFNLPKFNFNSLSEECQKEEFKDLDICQDFIQDNDSNLSVDEFEEKIEEVKKEKSLIYKFWDFVRENLIMTFVCIGIIGILFIILFLKHRKRSVLE